MGLTFNVYYKLQFTETLCLVMEYATLGNLLTFLQTRAKVASQAADPQTPPALSETDGGVLTSNEDEMDNKQKPQITNTKSDTAGPSNRNLRPKDFCKFAEQVASGMYFLGCQNVGNIDC